MCYAQVKTFQGRKTENEMSRAFVIVSIENNIQVLFAALDASWKIPPGVMDGNIYWLGDYRECMNTKNFHYCTMADIMLFNQLVFISSHYYSWWYFMNCLKHFKTDARIM